MKKNAKALERPLEKPLDRPLNKQASKQAGKLGENVNASAFLAGGVKKAGRSDAEAHLQLADQRPFMAVGAAEQLLYSHQREVLLAGPAGTGKTRAALEKLFICMCNYPGMRALLVRKTRLSLTQSALVTWETKVVPAGHSMLRGPGRAHRTHYAMSNGSQLVLGSMDNPDRMMSTEYDMVLACEATELELDDWEKLITRLRNGMMPFHQAIAECNPSFPGHWLNVRANAGLMQRLVSRHQDNPLLFDQRSGQWKPAGVEYLKTLERLSGSRRDQLLHGIWAEPEGIVYPEMAAAVQQFNGHASATGRRVYMGIDWGWTDPLAVVVGVLDGQNVLHIMEEIYAQKLPLDALLRRLTGLCTRWNVEATFADPARPELIHALNRADILCRPPAGRGIDAGIAVVESRLLTGRLKVDPQCVNLLSEATEYRYGVRTGGNPGPRAFLGRDHALDALRYLVSGLDANGADAENAVGATAEAIAPGEPRQLRFDFNRVWGE